MNLLMILGSEGIDPAHSQSWWKPEQAELIYGSAASIIVFAALFYALRKPVADFFSNRTKKVQADLDSAASDKQDATAEAAQIRQAAGDIDAERKRLFDEADREAEQILADGRARLQQEIEELNARADADIAAAGGRTNNELQGEIARLANHATEAAIANGVVDSTTQQELIESFIARVGQGVTS